MMTISKRGLELIKRFEGFSATPYFCPAGKLTIGYGHIILPEESRALINEQDAERLLKNDIKTAEQAVLSLVTVELTQGQFDALTSFVFNIGNQAFEKSTLLRILNRGLPEQAVKQFSRWVYANGRKLEGLVRRRAAEAALFVS